MTLTILWCGGLGVDAERTNLVESTVGKEIRKSGEVTKNQLIKMMMWRIKYLNLKNENLDFIEEIDENALMCITKMALQINEDLDIIKIKVLCIIKGLGPARASVILSFYNPLRYGVFNWRVWKQLFPDEKIKYFPEYYVRFLKELRKKSDDTGEKVRDIEFALWKLDKESSKDTWESTLLKDEKEYL